MAESGFVDVAGGRLYHEVEGDGHPLLLIHGGLGDLRMWDEQVPAFVALDEPERVDALVSVAGGISGYEPPESVEPPPWDEMERLWNAKDFAALAELETQVWVDGWGQPPDRVDPELRRKVLDRIRTSYAVERTEGKPQPLSPAAAQRLDDVRVPVLVLIGLADEPEGNVTLAHLASSVRGARSVELPNVAHMIQLEDPALFNQLVLEFLAEVDRERAEADA